MAFKIIKMYEIQLQIPENWKSGAGFTIYRRNGTAPLYDIPLQLNLQCHVII